MRGGRVGSLAASPTLVGAVTVLVVVVAVFLSYQANQGLPFVPTYKVSAELPNADNLVAGNEVRIGGIRVGQIKSVDPETVNNAPCPNDPTRQCTTQVAKVNMELNENINPLPVNSTVVVRARSALGLKYLEIDRGNSSQGFQPGATIPLTAARPEPVEIDQVFNMFDEPDPGRDSVEPARVRERAGGARRGPERGDRPAEAARRAADAGDEEPGRPEHRPLQLRLLALGDGGRGRAGRPDPGPAVRGPRHHLRRAWRGSRGPSSRSRSRARRPPRTQRSPRCPRSGPSWPTRRSCSASCGRASPRSRRSRRTSARASSTGVKALPLSPAFNAQLDPTAQALLNLSNDPASRQGINNLTDLNNTLGPPLNFITPAQSICNYGTLLFRNVASFLSSGNSHRHQPALHRAPAADRPEQRDRPELRAGERRRPGVQLPPLQPVPEHGRARPEPDECEAGNETYIAGPAGDRERARATRGSTPRARSSSRRQRRRRARSDPGRAHNAAARHPSARTTTSGSTARVIRRTGCATP